MRQAAGSANTSGEFLRVEDVADCWSSGTQLWDCLPLRMKGYCLAALMVTATCVLFVVNPLVWKHLLQCCTSVSPERSQQSQKEKVDVSLLTTEQQLSHLGNEVFGKSFANQNAASFSQKTHVETHLQKMQDADAGTGADRESAPDCLGSSDRFFDLCHDLEIAVSERVAGQMLNRLRRSPSPQDQIGQAADSPEDPSPELTSSPQASQMPMSAFSELFRRLRGSAPANRTEKTTVFSACKKVWCRPEFVIVTVMSAIMMLAIQGIVAFVIIYQVSFRCIVALLVEQHVESRTLFLWQMVQCCRSRFSGTLLSLP